MKYLNIQEKPAADLDITSFMNLMIVLVPVLLLNMTFSSLKVIDLILPELSDRIQETPLEEQVIQILVTPQSLDLQFPAGVSLQRFAIDQQGFNQDNVRHYLKQVKATFYAEGQKKKDITLLLHPKASYKTLVSLMDTVRSTPAVVATSVVRAELFPDVALGDYILGDYTGEMPEDVHQELSVSTSGAGGTGSIESTSAQGASS